MMLDVAVFRWMRYQSTGNKSKNSYTGQDYETTENTCASKNTTE